MWQSSPSKSLQPYDDTCHDPLLTKLTNHATHPTIFTDLLSRARNVGIAMHLVETGSRPSSLRVHVRPGRWRRRPPRHTLLEQLQASTKP